MSQSIDNRLGDLLKLYISGTCTYEQYQELLALLKIQTSDSQIEALLMEEVLNSRYHEAEQEVNWPQMLQTIVQQQAIVQPNLIRRMPVYKMFAAAAVIIALGTVAWWWLRQSNARHNDARQVAITTDIMPGRNGAVLTLANGQQLVLDSARNGDLYKQPGLNIVKHDSLIAYAAPAATDNNEKGSVSYNTLSTPRGRQFQLMLADGTKVWLNASSSIRYPAVFSGKERRVEVSGEVYFEVATLRLPSGQKMPFHVVTATQDVEVLGTHFNINAYEDEEAVRTTLLEGSVKVSQLAIGNKQLTNKRQQVILKPGEQAIGDCRLPIADCRLAIDHSPVINEVMAWKNGYFQFNRVDIKTIMRQVARWYDVEIIYEGPVTTDRFGGSIPRDATLAQVLHALEQSLVHFTIQGKQVIVKP